MANTNTGPNAAEINQKIGALDYRPEEILAFSGSRISSFIPRTGEMVLANQNLVEGVPDPLVVPKASLKLTIDLPSLTDDNSIVPETMDCAGISAAGDPAMDANSLMADSLSAVPMDVDVPLSLPGVTALPGVPMDKGLGEWYHFDQHFFYNLIKYNQSCFQCSSSA